MGIDGIAAADRVQVQLSTPNITSRHVITQGRSNNIDGRSSMIFIIARISRHYFFLL